jgi:SAM-dependent methyltransferase
MTTTAGDKPMPGSPVGPPIGLLAELTHRCPLQCPYCSNPLQLESVRNELTTDEWLRVLDQAAELGVLQIHLSGGEPASRRDLEPIVQKCAKRGLYSNLITSGIGLSRERLENVSVRLGAPADPRLPDASFDRVLMVHMYHEIAQPYEFLWRMRPSLKRDGLVIVVDANRLTQNHGTPPALLKCEFAAVGYTQVARYDMPSAGGYLAAFRAEGPRPEPAAIKPCRMT